MPSIAGILNFPLGIEIFTLIQNKVIFFGKLLNLFLFQASKSIKLNNFMVTLAGKSILFKEWELVVDEEDKVPRCLPIIYF